MLNFVEIGGRVITFGGMNGSEFVEGYIQILETEDEAVEEIREQEKTLGDSKYEVKELHDNLGSPQKKNFQNAILTIAMGRGDKTKPYRRSRTVSIGRTDSPGKFSIDENLKNLPMLKRRRNSRKLTLLVQKEMKARRSRAGGNKALEELGFVTGGAGETSLSNEEDLEDRKEFVSFLPLPNAFSLKDLRNIEEHYRPLEKGVAVYRSRRSKRFSVKDKGALTQKKDKKLKKKG